MKKLIALLLCLLLLCGAASAEQLTFGSLSFDSGAEEIDLGEQAVTSGGKTGWSSFIRFLSGFPNLKKVDMFATPVTESQVNRLREAFPDVSFGWTLKMMRYHLIRTDARGGINADARRCADARGSGIAGTDAGGHDNADFNPNLGPCGLAPSATVAFTVANPDAGARRADRDKEPDG